ncbi:hypothetical protein Sjap_011626 [Stephania japonica]|uniref:Uncharacterized protein n=1 Tax=Stephania japonica TaxID=461633 RepID=A0AAP0P5Q5_9MAGN
MSCHGWRCGGQYPEASIKAWGQGFTVPNIVTEAVENNSPQRHIQYRAKTSKGKEPMLGDFL